MTALSAAQVDREVERLRGSPVVTEAHLQVAAYSHLWECMSGEKTETAQIVLFNADGTYKVEESRATWEQFEDVLRTYRAMQALNDGQWTGER